MSDSLIPSLSDGQVGSRFVTEHEIDSARARRDEQWKAAYARLGQEPPPQQQEDAVYDGRSLAEKLAANRVAKQEEWEEKNKLANQFRALEEDEIMFLDSIREKQEEEERIRKEMDGEELKSFREAVAARTSTTNNAPPVISPPQPAPVPSKPAAKPAVSAKKDPKKSLKGLIVKKKAKPAAAATTSEKAPPANKGSSPADDELPSAKRRKVSTT
ncbi:hypothetical protein EST38_g1089 [Candolleomyces aberdarensis]|uniref:FAM192A/Fyv6 N-terminal domain-containing protein n=1 Tax=Candolleomyces aberdarensis TaxID=2316362 RepID=A0A4Q2E094_9AGAR|nr:hypothetical protein EST38_g1089 [Candolleomyces aberdarensis]